MLWGSLWHTIQALGTTAIEVHEWGEATVRAKRLPNSPDFQALTTRLPDLTFSGWNLAHAVVKADYLDRRNLTMPGMAFMLQVESLLEFGKSPLELSPGTARALSDVSLTSLSGRVGQGLAILYGQRLGFEFSAHLRSHVHSLPAGSPASAHKDDAMADFLFASSQQTILIESKGSFTLEQNDCSAIKAKLKDALIKQIDPWMGYLNPAPANGYVVFSCLREDSWAPSALFVVDPDGAENANAGMNFTPDQVQRENYAAWLRAMGLPGPAARLVNSPFAAPTGPRDEISFFVQEVSGRRYAFREDLFGWHLPWRWHQPVIGIELDVLRAISKSIEYPDVSLADSLQQRRPHVDGRQDEASIFPDGSLFGPLKVEPLDVEYVLL